MPMRRLFFLDAWLTHPLRSAIAVFARKLSSSEIEDLGRSRRPPDSCGNFSAMTLGAGLAKFRHLQMFTNLAAEPGPRATNTCLPVFARPSRFRRLRATSNGAPRLAARTLKGMDRSRLPLDGPPSRMLHCRVAGDRHKQIGLFDLLVEHLTFSSRNDLASPGTEI